MRVLQEGRTALMHAADNGHTATAAQLVRLGADINAKDWVRAWEGVELMLLRVLQAGRTALMRAAREGHTVTAAELVRLGADINENSHDYVRACEGAAGADSRG